jgi:flagellar protein FlaG
METNAKIARIAPIAAPSGAATSGSFDRPPGSREAEEAARYRLVIEEGPSAGSYVYKTLDRVTGEVVRQLPREQVVQLMQGSDYASGSVIDTSA